MKRTQAQVDIAIVGGGIGGLATAALLNEAGRSVVVLEKSPRFGGRGGTQSEAGYQFNLGPHALYRTGAGMRVLDKLGVNVPGGVPSASGGFAVRAGKTHTLPGGFISLLTTDLLGVAGKLETARLLATLPRVDASDFESMTLADWLRGNVRDAVAAELIGALIRLSTYANAPELLSAGAALRQLQMALDGNVKYLDGGWQSMVDQLCEKASQGGGEIRCGVRVGAVSAAGDGSWRIDVHDSDAITATAVVLALPPAAAGSVLQGQAAETLLAWTKDFVPVRAACLDIGLKTLPKSRNLFALGIDAPLYLSVHSSVARLAEDGKMVVHAAKYLAAGEKYDAAAVERELEALMDLIQPGWREFVEHRRFLPDMTVAATVVAATAGGTSGRPSPTVSGAEGLFLVGDWVGDEGMLADASFASAETVAARIGERFRANRAAA